MSDYMVQLALLKSRKTQQNLKNEDDEGVEFTCAGAERSVKDDEGVEFTCAGAE